MLLLYPITLNFFENAVARGILHILNPLFQIVMDLSPIFCFKSLTTL